MPHIANIVFGMSSEDSLDRMRATDIPVKDLVADIQSGKLRLPAMQRRYVWTGRRVRDLLDSLLDSLYRGYPSGAILVCETDKEAHT